jgi:hypothetical protein
MVLKRIEPSDEDNDLDAHALFRNLREFNHTLSFNSGVVLELCVAYCSLICCYFIIRTVQLKVETRLNFMLGFLTNALWNMMSALDFANVPRALPHLILFNYVSYEGNKLSVAFTATRAFLRHPILFSIACLNNGHRWLHSRSSLLLQVYHLR